MEVERFLRAMAWERAKGELRALMQTFCHENKGLNQFEKMDKLTTEYIKTVEDNGLQE